MEHDNSHQMGWSTQLSCGDQGTERHSQAQAEEDGISPDGAIASQRRGRHADVESQETSKCKNDREANSFRTVAVNGRSQNCHRVHDKCNEEAGSIISRHIS